MAEATSIAQVLPQLNILVAFSGGTLLAALVMLFKFSRFVSRIELKTDIMWSDYEERNHNRRHDDREEQ